MIENSPNACASAPRSATLRAWAELTRISNLPTVVSNVWASAGLVNAFLSGPDHLSRPISSIKFVLLLAAISAVYLGGMIFNDLCDAAIDRRERPHRPIPSGRVSPRSAAVAAMMMLIGGPALLLFCNPFSAGLGVVLSLLVVTYNLIHARWGISIFVMGACRALIYPIVFAVALPPAQLAWIFYLGGLLGAYVTMFSIVARHEVASAHLIRWPALVIPVWPLVFVCWSLVGMAEALPWVRFTAISTYGVYLLWTIQAARHVYARPPRVVPGVLTWLAGICLFDAWLASYTGNPWVLAGPVVCFVLTIWAHRRVPGT